MTTLVAASFGFVVGGFLGALVSFNWGYDKCLRDITVNPDYVVEDLKLELALNQELIKRHMAQVDSNDN